MSANLVRMSYDDAAVGRRLLVKKNNTGGGQGALADGQHGTESSDGWGTSAMRTQQLNQRHEGLNTARVLLLRIAGMAHYVRAERRFKKRSHGDPRKIMGAAAELRLAPSAIAQTGDAAFAFLLCGNKLARWVKPATACKGTGFTKPFVWKLQPAPEVR